MNWYGIKALFNVLLNLVLDYGMTNQSLGWQVGPMNITEFKYRFNSDEEAARVFYRYELFWNCVEDVTSVCNTLLLLSSVYTPHLI